MRIGTMIALAFAFVAGCGDDGGDTGPRLMIAEDPWYATSLKNNTPGGFHSYRAGNWVEPACSSLSNGASASFVHSTCSALRPRTAASV